MIAIEIPTNPNCPAVELRVFHELDGGPRMVVEVRLERQPGRTHWYAITGWTTSGMPCPARLQKVDDSGDGVAFLLYGGDAGLRLQPADHQAPWHLTNAQQWGEPFLILTDLDDVQLEPSTTKGMQGGNDHG